MKHFIGVGVAALAVVVAGCQASPSARNEEQSKVTANGCVQSVDNDSRFILTNATLSTSPASSSTRPADDPAASSAASGLTYRLDGKSDELRQHVNHQVEIAGHWDNPKSASAASEQELEVDSVRMISASCTR